MGFSLPGQLTGFLLSSILALIVWRLKFLTLSGAIGAVIVGSVIFGVNTEFSYLGRWIFVIPLLFFFFSSTALSFIRNERKRSAMRYAEKDGPRDFWQVMANGGLPALILLIGTIYCKDGSFINEFIRIEFSFLAALAVANADTWATEIGTLASEKPWRLFDFKRLEPGQSGGITKLGLALAFLGGATVAASAWIYRLSVTHDRFGIWYAVVVVGVFGVIGLFGSLVDSVLGAHLQAKYQCGECSKEVESKRHCGNPAKHLSGLKFLNNDLVNFISQLLTIPIALLILNILEKVFVV